MRRITGHIIEKKKKWYGVINLYDTEGKRHEKWQSLDLEAGNKNKREAQYRLNKILDQYNTDDLYLHDKMTHAERERSRIAHMQVIEYLPQWLETHKINVSETTYLGYKTMIESRMIPFFREYGDLKVKDITGDEINEYYICIRTEGLKGSTAQRHHALLHLAFKSAVKRRIISSNPVEQADRPKATQFIGGYYNANELRILLEKAEGDPIYMPILLSAYYGLRRSEAVGLKWSAVDFDNKTISINHKIIENKNGVKGLDVMKTKSSYRTLPLIPQVEEALLKEKERQEEMKRVMRRAYSKKYTEYICVDALGLILRPDYVSDHFKIFLRLNGLRSIRFHDLRHSCASLLLAQGVPMKMIQDWLGHSDMGTTANIYSHIDSESKKASALAIGSALE
ncbi:MAG: site-specific integrase [Clostridia bacterium]|nr:site-specific integrase [Clostridia bacterium]